MAELDWLDLGFDGRALGHLVSQCGWFYEGHRAENDILALIYLLAHEARGGQTVLAQLMAASGQLSYRVNAVEAPFEAKDMLKSRGYRWDGALRFWWRTVPEDELEAERMADAGGLSRARRPGLFPAIGLRALLPVRA
jgi:DNA polymerase-3 subunit epsilon